MRASALVAHTAIAVLVIIGCTDTGDPTDIPDGPSQPVAVVAVNPTEARIVVGAQLSVHASPQDQNGNRVANRRVRWSSSDPNVASVSDSGNVTAHKPGTAAIIASSDIKFGVASVTVTGIPVATVLVVPQSAILSEGDSLQLYAEVSGADSQLLLDRTVIWSSSEPASATVSQDGMITARTPGTARITATVDGISKSITVIINPAPVASVELNPTTLTITKGQSAQIIATLRASDGRVLSGRTITWSSSNTAIVAVSPSGAVTAAAVGTATITATSEGQSASVAVTVQPPAVNSMYITPGSLLLTVGQSATLSAVLLDASGNVIAGGQVSWSSSDVSVATVSSASGAVTAVAPGSATITAASGGRTATASVTVAQQAVERMDVTPSSANLLAGQTVQLTAIPRSASGQALSGRSISWASSNTSVGTVSSTGLVTAMSAGAARITATSEGKSASASIDVTLPQVASVSISPSSASLITGETTQLVAVTRDAGGATLTGRVVTWTSSNTQVATVSGGLVVAVSGGSTTITATSEGRSATASVIVTPPTSTVVASVTVSPSSVSLNVGQTAIVSATAKDATGGMMPGVGIIWSSANPAVATVSSNGVVIGQGAGTTQITATAQGQSGSTSVMVTSTPPPPTAAPELPRVFLNTTYVQPTGNTITVSAGGNLQQAINNANPGDVIMLQAGAQFTGDITLPLKTGSGWVTIRSAGTLPPEGTRMTPALAATHNLPKIVAGAYTPALVSTAPAASQYRLIGIEVTPAAGVPKVGALVAIDAGTTPSQIILDRMYIHGLGTAEVQRCVLANGARVAVIDSWISDCHGKGYDSQAIVAWNGPGPFKIVNNYLEGAGENVMFGGADPSITGLTPSDIEIRRNHFFKPMAWKNVWTVKNLLEFKHAQRVLVEGNVFENSWADAQIGWAVVMWSGNDGGRCTWCVTQDVTFRYNRIHNVNHGFQLTDRSPNAVIMKRVLIAHNVLTSVGVASLGGQGGRLYQMAGPIVDLTIEHNTAFAPNSQFLFVSQPASVLPGLVLRNNIGGAQYNVFSSYGQGATALQLYGGPNYQFMRNVVVGGTSPTPPNNSYPSTASAVGFVNYAAGDYRLGSGSPYRGTATDGTDPGADIAGLSSRTQGVIVP